MALDFSRGTLQAKRHHGSVSNILWKKNLQLRILCLVIKQSTDRIKTNFRYV